MDRMDAAPAAPTAATVWRNKVLLDMGFIVFLAPAAALLPIVPAPSGAAAFHNSRAPNSRSDPTRSGLRAKCSENPANRDRHAGLSRPFPPSATDDRRELFRRRDDPAHKTQRYARSSARRLLFPRSQPAVGRSDRLPR